MAVSFCDMVPYHRSTISETTVATFCNIGIYSVAKNGWQIARILKGIIKKTVPKNTEQDEC